MKPFLIDSIRDILGKFLSKSKWDSQMKRYAIWDEWANIVGTRVSGHATPLKWMQNVLLVGVDDASWLTELRMMEGEILKKIRAHKPDLKIDAIRWILSLRGTK